ncbi:MAG: hypothetical protein RLZZ511_864 [Cyanobacteriota bacterium]
MNHPNTLGRDRPKSGFTQPSFQITAGVVLDVGFVEDIGEPAGLPQHFLVTVKDQHFAARAEQSVGFLEDALGNLRRGFVEQQGDRDQVKLAFG